MPSSVSFKFCFCKNNKRTIIKRLPISQHVRLLATLPSPLDIPRCLWGLRPKYTNDVYNNDVGKGEAQDCEAYEVK
jgi:hypothetical protein